MKKLLIILTLLVLTNFVKAQDSIAVKIIDPNTLQEQWKRIPNPNIARDNPLPVVVKGDKGDKGDPGAPGKDATLSADDINKIISSIHIQEPDLSGNPSLRSFGAIPNDGIDDTNQIQACIEFYRAHNLSFVRAESGRYDLSKEIYLGDPNGVDFVFLSLIGDGNAFDPQAKGSGGTQLYQHNKNTACIKIQGGKGLSISYFNFAGQNTGLENYTYADVVNEKDNFNPNGCLDTRNDCHAAIIIDPLSTGRFSTGIRVNECYGHDFIAGIVISPQGSQNGEDCKFSNIWFDHMKVCFSSGNSQNRTNSIEHFTNWGCTLYSFSSDSYGGVGCPFFVNGYNAAGGNKYIFRTGSWYGNQENLREAHVEEMYAGGGCFTGRDVKINIQNSTIYFMGSSVSQIPSQLFQCKTLHAIDCNFYTSYGKTPVLMALSADYAVFDNCNLDNPVILSVGKKLTYINCDFGTGDNVDADHLQKVAQVPSIATINNNNTWTFNSTDSNLKVGQYISIWKGNLKSEFFSGNPLDEPAGTILSINAGVVTASGNPYGIATGQSLDISTYKW